MSRHLNLLTGQWNESKSTKSKNPEAIVKRQIEDYLRKIGGYVRTINSGGVIRNNKWNTSSQGSGIPDLLCWLPFGIFLACEVKAVCKERTGTDQQHKFLQEIISRGMKGCIASSVDHVKLCLGQTREEQLATLAALKPVKRARDPSTLEPLFP